MNKISPRRSDLQRPTPIGSALSGDAHPSANTPPGSAATAAGAGEPGRIDPPTSGCGTSTTATPHRLIDGRAAAQKVGCSHRHWLRLCDDGLAPAGVKLRALRRWDEREIDTWIAAGCPPRQHRNGSQP